MPPKSNSPEQLTPPQSKLTSQSTEQLSLPRATQSKSPEQFPRATSHEYTYTAKEEEEEEEDDDDDDDDGNRETGKSGCGCVGIEFVILALLCLKIRKK